MYILDGNEMGEIEDTTFAELDKKENDVEEILRKNIDKISDDENMLVIGQQVRNEANGRSDLTAIDGNGDIVLIEIKRDKSDIEMRKEAFEFQAIRYAASYASIKSTDELVQNTYIGKHKEEFQRAEYANLTDVEIAQRQLDDFMEGSEMTSFNEHQRIILVASDFDEQTLSAVAWLNSNNVDISCYQICLYSLKDETANVTKTLIDMKRLLPLDSYDDFYVNITYKSPLLKGEKKGVARRTLPRLKDMLQWGVVKVGDVLVAKDKNTENKVTLISERQVKTNDGKVLSIQSWLKTVFTWPSIATYGYTVHEATGKTLSELRSEYMAEHLGI